MKNKNYFFYQNDEEVLEFVRRSVNVSKFIEKFIIYENNKRTLKCSNWYDVKKYIANKYGNIVFGGWTD